LEAAANAVQQPFSFNLKNLRIIQLFPILINTMTIAYLVNGLYSSYQSRIWQGIHHTCKKKGIRFIAFTGGDLRCPIPFRYQRNMVYDLLSRERIDGIIINNATLFHYVSDEEKRTFYGKYKNFPIVNLGYKFDDIPSVIVDNKKGVRQGMRHLIQTHKFRKIAFIKGPENNSESDLRFEAYKEILEESGIPFDPSLVETGDFRVHSGSIAFEQIKKRHADVEAILAANDYMALGVFQEALK
jgi:DNA-binding LacI/PurR family transcriptional regulator